MILSVKAKGSFVRVNLRVFLRKLVDKEVIICYHNIGTIYGGLGNVIFWGIQQI